MPAWAWIAGGLLLACLQWVATLLLPVQASLRLRGWVAPGEGGRPLPVALAARVRLRCAGVWVALEGAACAGSRTWRARARLRVGAGRWARRPLRQLRREGTVPAGLAALLSARRPQGSPPAGPPVGRQHRLASLLQPRALAAASRALLSTLARRVRPGTLSGRLEIGLADAMATALAAAAAQSAALAALARLGWQAATLPGPVRVVPRFGRPCASLRAQATASTAVGWLAWAGLRALAAARAAAGSPAPRWAGQASPRRLPQAARASRARA